MYNIIIPILITSSNYFYCINPPPDSTEDLIETDWVVYFFNPSQPSVINQWRIPILIVTQSHLELLFKASELTGDDKYKSIAISHANKTIKNHFREDYSSYHVVAYDPENGKVQEKVTHQGYSDESAWSRGQAWGLYGYVMMYRFTLDKKYLDQAKGIADFILNHPNLPEDKIPYWDFNDPEIPNCEKDASSAAAR